MSQPHGQPLQMSNQANQFPLAHSNHQLQNHHAQTPSLQSAIRPPMSNQASFPNGMGPQQTTPTQLLAFATDELSMRVGQTLAGLLNATLVRVPNS